MWWSCPVGSPPRRSGSRGTGSASKPFWRRWLWFRFVFGRRYPVKAGRPSELGCTNALACGRHDHCPASQSSRHPNETTVSSRDGLASTRRGGRKIQAQCRGDSRESRDVTPGCSRVVNPSVSPARTGHNYSRSSISAEGTAGNSPGIHSWGSGARADMRSRESRRDGGGCTGWMFRRPYGTRLVDRVPSNPGLRKASSWAIPRRPLWDSGAGLTQQNCSCTRLSSTSPSESHFSRV